MKFLFKYLNLAYRGFKIQKNVIRALIYRELKTRVSKAKFGVIGIFVEPIITLSIFLGIFAFFRVRQTYGLNLILFLGTGFTFYRAFQSILFSSLNSLEANESLFYYQQVKPLDTVIARCIVESFINLIIFFIMILISFLINDSLLINNFPLLVLSYFSIIFYSLSVGIIMMVAGSKFEAVKLILPFLSRPLFFTSGVLFSVNRIPDNLIPFIIWNPVIHSIENGRHAFTEEFTLSDHISIIYALKVSLLMFLLSLFIYKNNERFLIGK